jgi:hypothetical protein
LGSVEKSLAHPIAPPRDKYFVFPDRPHFRESESPGWVMSPYALLKNIADVQVESCR